MGETPAPVGLPSGVPEGLEPQHLAAFVYVDVFVGGVDRHTVGRIFVERP